MHAHTPHLKLEYYLNWNLVWFHFVIMYWKEHKTSSYVGNIYNRLSHTVWKWNLLLAALYVGDFENSWYYRKRNHQDGKNRLKETPTKAKVHHRNNAFSGFRVEGEKRKIKGTSFSDIGLHRGEILMHSVFKTILPGRYDKPHPTDVVKPPAQTHTASKGQVKNSNPGPCRSSACILQPAIKTYLK